MSSEPVPCCCIVTAVSLSAAAESRLVFSLMPEWRNLVLTAGGAAPRADPATATPAEVSTKTATRRRESVAAR